MQHCYIGGGSEGLGLSLACQLAQRGAHVTIVSRSQAKLDKARAQVEVRPPLAALLFPSCPLTRSHRSFPRSDAPPVALANLPALRLRPDRPLSSRVDPPHRVPSPRGRRAGLALRVRGRVRPGPVCRDECRRALEVHGVEL